MARAAFFVGVSSSLAWAMGCSVSDEGLTFVPDDQVKTGAGGASAGAGGQSGTGGTTAGSGGTSGGGTGGTGGTTAGSGGAGGNPLEPQCQACLGDKCPTELGACVGDSDCLKCIVAPSPMCQAKANAVALRACGCANCDKQCAALDKCGAGGAGGTGGSAGKGGGGGAGTGGSTAGTGGAGAGGTAGAGGAGAGGTAGSAGSSGSPVFSSCEQCIVSVCQKEVIACNQDAACSPCINGGGGPECQQNANLKAAQQCACTSECGELCGCATAFCGDGKISGKEDCDGADLGGKTCSTALGDPTALGSLSCSSSCHYDFSNCTAGTAFCGDKKVNQATEACDPPDLKTQTCATVTGNATATGTLGCNYKCGFDTSKCEIPGVCGDGVINAGEKCDGTKLNGATCSSVLGGGATGTLKCSSNCQYDTSKCSTGVMCGNGSIDFGEQCDGANLAGFDCKKLLGSPLAVGSLTCNSNCTFNGTGCSIPQAVCNNGLKEAGEQCDKTDFGGADCKSATGDPTSIGTLQCTGSCTYDVSKCMKGTVYCGDGVRNQANEQCDGGDLGGASCKDVLNNPAAQGQLLCTTSCTFNASQCSVPTGVCGDGALNQPTESCDSGLLAPGVTCQSLRNSKQAQGSLSCNPQTCSIVDSGCAACSVSGGCPIAACGNGILDPGEECEPNYIPTNCQAWLNDPTALVDATSQPQCVNCKIDASTCKTPCGGPCDLNQCDGFSVCDPSSGKCTAGGPPPGLDDGNPCTFDYCDPQSGRVRHLQRADCCPHSVCKQGQILNAVGCAVTPSMDQCLAQIVTQDPFCYNNNWDGACQAHFQPGQPQFCNLQQPYTCQCAHPLCTEGAPMAPDCDPCVEAICQQDPHCCGQVWDASCVQKVQTICHIPPSGCN